MLKKGLFAGHFFEGHLINLLNSSFMKRYTKSDFLFKNGSFPYIKGLVITLDLGDIITKYLMLLLLN